MTGSDDHFTADERWERVRDAPPDLEFSTVYCSLEALAGSGAGRASSRPAPRRILTLYAGTVIASHTSTTPPQVV
ncbi:hypothetical protein [Rubrobacter indicoceani]|uniref:hypothetical protein n=1 Tax=Rubrobacter indicoceani TaxID=2051957 RepID=UPI0013C52A2F|nr:hypothetical protein [Rubrobacter indicoceani]